MGTKKAAENAANKTTSFSNISDVPASMKQLDSWLLWVLKDNKKVPLNLSGYPTDPTKGFSYSEVTAVYNPTVHSGLGFIAGEGIIAIDLDHCITDGQLSETARQLVDELQTYTEISVSGTGLHLFYIDKTAPTVGRKSKQLELYTANHYIAMTGNRLPDTPAELAVLNGKTAELLEKYFPVNQTNNPRSKQNFTRGECKMTNENILNQLKTDKKFNRLFYEGNISGYPSQSEADVALMCKLYTSTEGNTDQMRELFSQSALGKRDKWFREDYQEQVIRTAVEFMESKSIQSYINQLEELLQQNTVTITDIFTEETMKAIAMCKLDSSIKAQSIVLQMREKCKQSRITIGDYDKLLEQTVKQLVQSRYNDESKVYHSKLKTSGITLPVEYEIQLPQNILIDWENHKTLEITPDGYKRVLFDSINLISQIYVDCETHEEKIQVSTLKSNQKHWKNITATREIFATTSKITSLATAGLDVYSLNATDMVRYLKTYESVNSHIPSFNTITRTGWINNEFVFPLIKSNYLLDNSIKPNLDKAFSMAGDKSAVIPLIKEMKQIPIVNTLIGTMLAAPLVKILDCNNIVVHIYGQTGSGKTTATDFAFSLFGNPNVPGTNPTADATKVGLEYYFSSRHDLPAVIEDLNTASDFKTQNLLIKLPYQFVNRTGKLRGTPNGSNQKLLDFRGSLVTNGEKPLTTDTSEGGGKRRVIELQTPDELFDIMTVKEIYDTISDNYGLFGGDWIQQLQATKPAVLKQTYRHLSNELLQNYRNIPPLYLMSLSAIATANIYFSTWFLNATLDDAIQHEIEIIKQLIQQLPSTKQVADYMRAKQLIIEWIASHPKNFSTDDKAAEGYEMFGIIRNNYIAVFPMYLRKFLEDNGMSAVTIIKQLADDEFILRDDKHLQKKISLNGQKIRVYCIKKYEE